MNPQTGKWIIIAGVIVAVIGILIYFFHDKLNWLGKLPGDIRIEKENFRFYFAITTMIIISIVLTILVNIFKKFF
jgi:magnesium-transporting ATPase (P-type)